jgi:hypothetical protein
MAAGPACKALAALTSLRSLDLRVDDNYLEALGNDLLPGTTAYSTHKPDQPGDQLPVWPGRGRPAAPPTTAAAADHDLRQVRLA